MNTNEKILEEIRRQAFIRANQKRLEEEARQETRYNLEALQELTGLPGRELQTIAANVSAGYDGGKDLFFSIKNQIMMVSAGLGLICLCIWVLARLLI